MISFLRPIIGRLIAAWVAGFCTWLAVRFGVVIPEEAQTKMIESLVMWVIPILLTLYSLIHKLVNSKVNPGDGAKPKMVEAQKDQSDHLP